MLAASIKMFSAEQSLSWMHQNYPPRVYGKSTYVQRPLSALKRGPEENQSQDGLNLDSGANGVTSRI